MIQHTVAFRLKHAIGSPGERVFLDKALALRALPGVIDFRLMKQVSRKNEFTYGLSMYFMSHETYDGYNNHPEHVAFVNDIWLPEVADFLEIDYVDHSL